MPSIPSRAIDASTLHVLSLLPVVKLYKSHITLRHQRRGGDRPAASDPFLWFRIWLSQEHQLHNLPRTGTFRPTHETGLETLFEIS